MSEIYRILGCDNPTRAADVVFVHGLGDDAFRAWQHPDLQGADDSWPYWLGKAYPEVGIWSLGYAASKSKYSRVFGLMFKDQRDAGQAMALPDRGRDLLNVLVQNGVNERPLFFIAHSLGGLVVKQILRLSSDSVESPKRAVFNNTRALLFLATPHFGADLASLISSFRLLFGATVSVEDLRAHDAHLVDLYHWYRNHSETIKTETYYEMQPYRSIIIVNAASSQAGVGDSVKIEEDHVSIAKPRDKKAIVYKAALSLLKSHVLKPVNAPVAARAEDLVPFGLPPAAEQFFGRDEELAKLAGRLRLGKNAAVVGPAGLGKTALAAKALVSVVGERAANLSGSPFPDGVVYLDLYRHKGNAERVWNSLADECKGLEFMDRRPARERAEAACRARRMLIVIEGGEEADGRNGRADFATLTQVLSPQNRWLLLTRTSVQAIPSESIVLNENLLPEDAARLLDALTHGCIASDLSKRVLGLLEGHPLALTWAGNLLARGDEHPLRLIEDWGRQGGMSLSDPTKAEHTLGWLFNRSVCGLEDIARSALTAASLLSPEPVPFEAIQAALPESDEASLRRALKEVVGSSMLRCSEELDYWQFTHILGYSFARREAVTRPSFKVELAEWLRNHLGAALSIGGSADPASLQRDLQHAAALLRADQDRSLWDSLADPIIYEIRERLEHLGRLGLQTLALSAVAGWIELLPSDVAWELYWLRELSVVTNFQGGVLRDQGDLVGALTAFRESLRVRQRLVAADPSNAGWQCDLSVSFNNVGEVMRNQGDLGGALAAFRESLQVSQHLAAADPSNAVWQRNLSVCLDNVGGVLREQGDLAGALAAFREVLRVIQRLAAADPSNAGWQRDLSVSLNKVGDVLRDQGDLAGALDAFRESLQVIQRLAAADPSNVGWQHDLSVSLNKVGDVLCEQGDLAGALAAYREALQVIQRLAAADPSNAGWQRDLSVSQERIGDVLRDQGDLKGALAAFRESRQLRELLAAADPSNAGWQRDLSVSFNKVGEVLREQSDLTGALAAFRESLQVRQHLVVGDSSNAVWQRDLFFSLSTIATLLESQEELGDALTLAREGLGIAERLAALDPSNATWQKDVRVSRALVSRLQS